LSAPPIKEFVVLSRSDNFAPTPKTLIGASFFLLLAAAIFGGFNIAKVKTLRSAATQATTARDAAERSRLQHDKELKARQSAIATEQTKLAEGEAKTGAAEGQLTQILNEKKQIEEKQPASPNPGAPSSVELQAQLDDARQQLEAAEREKSLLSQTVQTVRDRSSRLKDEKSGQPWRMEGSVSGAPSWRSIRLTISSSSTSGGVTVSSGTPRC
jgi:hypothetical protein